MINKKMNEIIEIIREKIAECESKGTMFSLPTLDVADIEKNDAPCSGAILCHTEYNIKLHDGGNIHIDYQSKDKCRTFQVNPDRSYIVMSCSDSSFNYSTAWDEK